MLHDRRIGQLLALVLLLVFAHAAVGQTLKPGPQVLTFFSDVDDTEQPSVKAICPMKPM